MYNKITVYFDGDCPLCSREIRFIKSKDKKDLIHPVDINDPNFDPNTIKKTRDELMQRIHAEIHLPEGNKLVSGVDVFRELYSRIGLGFILWPTRLPILKQLTDLAYIIFAKNRLRISKAFGYCLDKCNLKF